MIAQVRDLLADFGEGYVWMCLQALNMDVEATINALLTQSAPAALNGVDKATTLQQAQALAAAKAAKSSSKASSKGKQDADAGAGGE